MPEKYGIDASDKHDKSQFYLASLIFLFMCGKFCESGSNSDNVFFFVRGERIQIALAKRHLNDVLL